MSQVLQYTLVDGIKCYSPEEAGQYADYPDGGFDLTDKLEVESFWVRSRNRLFKKVINSYATEFPKAKFLEIGCGTGDFIRHIADNKNLEITGSEIYSKGLHYAKKKLPHVEFIQFDAKQGRLAETFDIVAAFDVIEHIDNDVEALSNIHAMLNDGGYFVVTVPQYMFMWSRLDELVKHKRRYSKKELTGKLKQQGFRISYCSSYLFVLFPLMMISRMFGRNTDKSKAIDAELEDKVTFPGPINWIFDKVMRIDEVLIDLKLSLPFGGSLLAIAKKTRSI